MGLNTKTGHNVSNVTRQVTCRVGIALLDCRCDIADNEARCGTVRNRTYVLSYSMAEEKLNPERERQRRYERQNREKERDRMRRWRAANSYSVERSQYHGKTRAEINAIAVDQGGCGICGAKPTGLHQWHGDHDHKTGIFRGVLCRRCNIGLGCFRDKIKTLNAAIYYLEAHKRSQEKIVKSS
jgi:hypothetical protein